MATSPEEIKAVWSKYSTTTSYDAAGRRISTTDAAGNRSVMYYDAYGNLAYTINAEREVTAYTGELRTNKLETKRDCATRRKHGWIVGGVMSSELLAQFAALQNDTKDCSPVTLITVAMVV